MSKENVFKFFSQAARDQQLQEKLGAVSHQEELVNLGKQAGFEFEEDHVEAAIIELKGKPGFFRALAEAALSIFSPAHDDYPATGVQPFSGDPNPES
jgi:predicted ribosomally synthesized peptide with nif11-like leader